MDTFKAVVAYDGTDFHGFQRQVANQRTVQGEIEAALGQIGWSEKSINAAGRTDAGVHARGQVVAFQLSWEATLEDLERALNANLPPDVSVIKTERVDPEFHPRFSAKKRSYAYYIYQAPQRDPLRERFSWRVWPEPDFEVLSRSAKLLLGSHDFGAFGTAPIDGGHTVRTITTANWQEFDEELVFVIEADAFLYHMVRRLVGALVTVGSDPQKLAEFQRILSDPRKNWQGTMAPARGLVLEGVEY
jgi:tRNA pseudouridine38-40 synthase